MMRLRVALLGIGLSAFIFAAPAYALNPASGPGTEQNRFEALEKTKQTETRLKEEKKPGVEVSKENAKAPEQATEEVSFSIEKINVVGNTVISTDEIRKITAPWEGKPLKLSAVTKIAEDITKLYFSKGYITCRAYIPPQKLETKILEIRVLEGKLGEVKVEGNKFFSSKTLTRYVNRIKGKVIEYGELGRNILKTNLHPDREVKAVVIPGKDMGTSDLMMDVQDNFPLHIGGEVNNFGTKLTGKERYNAWVRDTNLFGLDDILAVRSQFGSQVLAIGGQYQLPIGPYDTEIGATFNYTDVSIGGAFTILDIGGTAYSYSLFINQPFLDTEHIDLTWTGSYESKTIHNTILGASSSNDDLRMLHTGINADETDPYGRTFLVNDFTLGTPWFGASNKNDPTLSRSGSGATFYKYDLALNRIHPVYDSTLLYLKLQAQSSPSRMVSAEQFDLGGAYSVRGYPQSDYLGDKGAVGSVEVHVPFYFIPKNYNVPFTDLPLWNRLNFVGFFDCGNATLKNPAVGEDQSKTYVGAGGGFRFDLPKNLTGRFEWAAPLGDAPTDNSQSQYYFVVSGDLA